MEVGDQVSRQTGSTLRVRLSTRWDRFGCGLAVTFLVVTFAYLVYDSPWNLFFFAPLLLFLPLVKKQASSILGSQDQALEFSQGAIQLLSGNATAWRIRWDDAASVQVQGPDWTILAKDGRQFQFSTINIGVPRLSVIRGAIPLQVPVTRVPDTGVKDPPRSISYGLMGLGLVLAAWGVEGIVKGLEPVTEAIAQPGAMLAIQLRLYQGIVTIPAIAIFLVGLLPLVRSKWLIVEERQLTVRLSHYLAAGGQWLHHAAALWEPQSASVSMRTAFLRIIVVCSLFWVGVATMALLQPSMDQNSMLGLGAMILPILAFHAWMLRWIFRLTDSKGWTIETQNGELVAVKDGVRHPAKARSSLGSHIIEFTREGRTCRLEPSEFRRTRLLE